MFIHSLDPLELPTNLHICAGENYLKNIWITIYLLEMGHFYIYIYLYCLYSYKRMYKKNKQKKKRLKWFEMKPSH